MKVEKGVDVRGTNAQLLELARRLEKGAINQAEYDAGVDRLLGLLPLPPADRQKDAAWERSRRPATSRSRPSS